MSPDDAPGLHRLLRIAPHAGPPKDGGTFLGTRVPHRSWACGLATSSPHELFNKKHCLQRRHVASTAWDRSELECAGMRGCSLGAGKQQDGVGGLSPSPLCLAGKIRVTPHFLGKVVRVAPKLLRLTPGWSCKPRCCCRRDMEQLRAGGDHPATMPPHTHDGSLSLPGLVCWPHRVLPWDSCNPQTLLRTKGSWMHPHRLAAPHESL